MPKPKKRPGEVKGFKRSCPNCDDSDRVIVRCFKCLRFCCSQCSVTGFCLDCHVENTVVTERSLYYEDKYSDKVVFDDI